MLYFSKTTLEVIMETVESNANLSEEQNEKKSQVEAFIKKIEKYETDPEYRQMMINQRRAKEEFKEFMKMPKEDRSKILFGIQCQLIRREVETNPDSPYNWQRREKEELQKARAKALNIA